MKQPQKIYVHYLDHTNGYREAKKYFDTYELAWAWMVETFDTPSYDFIHCD